MEKETGAEVSALPLMSYTAAVMADAPPVGGRIVGFADSVMRPTAAVPRAILSVLESPATAPPEIAVIVAVPFAVPALKVATACPLMSVSTFAG